MAPKLKSSNSTKVVKPLSSISSFNTFSRPVQPVASISKITATNTKKKIETIIVEDSDDESTSLAIPVSRKGKEREKVIDSKLDLSTSLWVDQFSPTCREDLGIHSRKLTDVEGWFKEAYDPKFSKFRRLLVLSGPSGAGKTATLRIIAKELDIEIVEFRNASSHTFAGDEGKESMVNQFNSFLFRAGMAPALDFGPPPTSANSTPSIPFDPNKKRIILLEDLPNLSHLQTRVGLRSALAQFLASKRVNCPLVVIISEAFARPGNGTETESTGNDGGGMGESVDARTVCGVEILQSPGCRQISFNPIAVTIMKKALTKILDQIYVHSPKALHSTLPPSSRPSIKTLEIIIANSNGDIRSALMSIEFLASNPKVAGVTQLNGGVQVKGKKRKSDGKGGGVSEEGVRDLLQFVTARESSLFIFHALGKVLYSKRWGESEVDDKKDLNRFGIEPEREQDRLPRHLKQFRRKPSKVNPDVLFAEAPVDSDVFLSFTHHNFPDFTNEIEECCGILEGMSQADALMKMDGDDWLKRAPLTSSYSHAIAVRSTMLSLPSPVPRRKHVMRKSPLWESLRISKGREEGLEELGSKLGGELGISSGIEGIMGSQRSRRNLGSEIVPFLSIIRNDLAVANPFLHEIAKFPVLVAESLPTRQQKTGEALEENEMGVEEEGLLTQEEIVEPLVSIEESKVVEMEVEDSYILSDDDIED